MEPSALYLFTQPCPARNSGNYEIDMDVLPFNPNPPPLMRLAFLLLEEFDAALLELGEVYEADGLCLQHVFECFGGLREAGSGGGSARGRGGGGV